MVDARASKLSITSNPHIIYTSFTVTFTGAIFIVQNTHKKFSWAGIVYSVHRLVKGWTVRGSKPLPSRPALSPTQPSIKGLPFLSQR
jgi:hypothetical protein